LEKFNRGGAFFSSAWERRYCLPTRWRATIHGAYFGHTPGGVVGSPQPCVKIEVLPCTIDTSCYLSPG
jgi:hypothetical protein